MRLIFIDVDSSAKWTRKQSSSMRLQDSKSVRISVERRLSHENREYVHGDTTSAVKPQTCDVHWWSHEPCIGSMTVWCMDQEDLKCWPATYTFLAHVKTGHHPRVTANSAWQLKAKVSQRHGAISFGRQQWHLDSPQIQVTLHVDSSLVICWQNDKK